VPARVEGSRQTAEKIEEEEHWKRVQAIEGDSEGMMLFALAKREEVHKLLPEATERVLIEAAAR
jgi:hypothetical protein